jgi:hypothetical protein
MKSRFAKSVLIGGGLFNSIMGIVFLLDPLLADFFNLASRLESTLFHRLGSLAFPADPTIRMFIHGFGCGALILGITLIYSARDPLRYWFFILVDGLGRLVYGSLMVAAVLQYSLLNIILVFAALELFFALSYIGICWKLMEA